MIMVGKNPYLTEGRLADVIAAITALANYRYYKISFEKAAEKIANIPEEANKWEIVLKEHPEFFRISGNTVSLVWRRQYPKLYDTKLDKEITRQQFKELSRKQRDFTISRRPLNTAETTALIDVAIRLHERAIEDMRVKFWWIPLLSAVLAFVGALTGVFFAKS